MTLYALFLTFPSQNFDWESKVDPIFLLGEERYFTINSCVNEELPQGETIILFSPCHIWRRLVIRIILFMYIYIVKYKKICESYIYYIDTVLNTNSRANKNKIKTNLKYWNMQLLNSVLIGYADSFNNCLIFIQVIRELYLLNSYIYICILGIFCSLYFRAIVINHYHCQLCPKL